ncbi:MAG: isoleucine--tRNA ligase [Myxococcota bacterium]|nr:isoleucine--tRNA ligase [Myxococcota bacterium]
MKANLLQMEPRFQTRWADQEIQKRQAHRDHPRGKLTLHDGPPYANGKIHLGHLLNKVLKDFVVRSRNMQGYDIDWVPGWDCHGLPIEHQVMKNLGDKARELSTTQIRFKCQKYAEKFVGIQSEQMQRLGTWGNYENPYLTMKPAYEGATLEVFSKLVEEGLVYRDLKPVHWSIANQTALADAELEYEDREDTSVYVLFELQNTEALPSSLNAPNDAIHVMIWTTTPWTLPANMAVAVSPEETYGLYRWTKDGKTQLAILGQALNQKVLALGKAEDIEELGTCIGKELYSAQLAYQHPFVDRNGRILLADYVTMEDGTGLVHTAPGHGEDDYRTGLKEGIKIYCPVMGDGTYDDTVPDWLAGKDVWTANGEVTEHLRQSGHLFFDHPFMHSYPHDWRSKTPTIFRATEQWFISIDNPAKTHGVSLREMALKASDDGINFIPTWGQSRLRGMLEARPDWCISRQRSWGLPIPAFMKHGQQPLLTAASVNAVAKAVREKGSDLWFEGTVAEILAHYDASSDSDAPQWIRENPKQALTELEKCTDIFDVWFESGSSWNAVLNERGLGYPAELYIEGSDQHRGWFQLSLLPALGATGRPPFKTLLTHGFIVDANGRKMSKSIGNTIDVEKLLSKYGADISRWWVLGLNFVNDIKADWKFIQTASEEYRKIRNTIRFLLGNLENFDVTKDSRPLQSGDESSIDYWIKRELDLCVNQVVDGYKSYQFRKIRDAVFNFCNDTLSAIYMAAVKDRLYCEAPDSEKRRRTQTVMFEITDTLLRLLAPIIPHTADEAFLVLHGLTEANEQSIHLGTLPEERDVGQAHEWNEVLTLRSQALKALEDARNERGLSNPLDAGVRITVKGEVIKALKGYEGELSDLCGTSRFTLSAGEQLEVEIDDLKEEPRCARSWKRDGTVSERNNGLLLSERDYQVVKNLDLSGDAV